MRKVSFALFALLLMKAVNPLIVMKIKKKYNNKKCLDMSVPCNNDLKILGNKSFL